MNYHHLNYHERRFISRHRKTRSIRWIARCLGRAPTTISRELERNYDRQNGPGYYKAKRAQEMASGRRMRRRGWSWFTAKQWTQIRRRIAKRHSPEQIAGRMRDDGLLNICHETIYRHIWNDKATGGVLYRDLRHSGKLRRKRYGKYDSRGRLAGKRPIEARPPGAINRSRPGHWEIDTVVGPGKPCILTLVDRVTVYLHIRKLDDRTAEETAYRLTCLLRRHPGRFKTITADNGSEFHGYKTVESKYPVRFYFAKPYHSHERGSSENVNGLIRQYIPKRSSRENLTQEQCNRIAKEINSRPRKRLGWSTPEEINAKLT